MAEPCTVCDGHGFRQVPRGHPIRSDGLEERTQFQTKTTNCATCDGTGVAQ